MNRILTLFVIIASLTGCVTAPDYITGADCWRTGVMESGNTGRMTDTPITDIPVVVMGEKDLYAACDIVPEPISWHTRGQYQIEACYHPKTDTIYVLRLSQYGYMVQHEKCHALLGEKHNSCNGKGYGIGNNESDCDWDKQT